MIGRLDEELAEAIEDMLMAVVNPQLRPTSAKCSCASARRRPARPATSCARMSRTSSPTTPGQSIQDMDLSGALNSLLEIIRRYNITLPPPLSMLLRTLVELEGTAQQLSP